jgi:transposase
MDLPEHERGHLQDLLAARPHLTTLAEHVRAFAELLTTRRGNDLEDWMSAVQESDLPALHTFVRGLRKDLDAVVAGLSLPYTNGPIEGTNTKFKLLKRQMYGRQAFACCDNESCSVDRHHLFCARAVVFTGPALIIH